MTSLTGDCERFLKSPTAMAGVEVDALVKKLPEKSSAALGSPIGPTAMAGFERQLAPTLTLDAASAFRTGFGESSGQTGQ